MKHQDIEERITSYLLGDLTEPEADLVRAHLESCEGCRASARDIELTLGQLRDALVAEFAAPDALSLDRKARVFDATSAPTSEPGALLAWGRPWMWKVAGLAAMVVALVGLVLPAFQSAGGRFGGYAASSLGREPTDLALAMVEEVTSFDSESVRGLQTVEKGRAPASATKSAPTSFRPATPLSGPATEPAEDEATHWMMRGDNGLQLGTDVQFDQSDFARTAVQAEPESKPETRFGFNVVTFEESAQAAPVDMDVWYDQQPGERASGWGGQLEQRRHKSMPRRLEEEVVTRGFAEPGGASFGSGVSSGLVSERPDADGDSSARKRGRDFGEVQNAESDEFVALVGKGLGTDPVDFGLEGGGGGVKEVRRSVSRGSAPARERFRQEAAREEQSEVFYSYARPSVNVSGTERLSEVTAGPGVANGLEELDFSHHAESGEMEGEALGQAVQTLDKRLSVRHERVESPGAVTDAKFNRDWDVNGVVAFTLPPAETSGPVPPAAPKPSSSLAEGVLPEIQAGIVEKFGDRTDVVTISGGAMMVDLPAEPALQNGSAPDVLASILLDGVEAEGRSWEERGAGLAMPAPTGDPPQDAVSSLGGREFKGKDRVAGDLDVFSNFREEDLKQLKTDVAMKVNQPVQVAALTDLYAGEAPAPVPGLVELTESLETADRFDLEMSAPSVESESGFVARAYGVNPFVTAAESSFSTFAIDVDTAAYTLARKHLLSGTLPPAEAVRTEEFVNYFDYAYRPPQRTAFAVYTDLADTPFGDGRLLRIGVKGKRLGRDEQRPAVLTFVIDTSGSMDTPDRLGLVRDSLAMLLDGLGPEDRVAIVQVDSQARLILPHTPAGERETIEAALETMQCSGSTHLEGGIRLGYQVAADGFRGGAVNRVLLLSDGAANLGSADPESILALVDQFRTQGVYCSVFGFGIGTYNDAMLEQLANRGDGVYRFVDSLAESERLFVDDLAATLQVIASDVKIQVEFDPDRVASYRQVGYENRQLTKEQFRDDQVDAGEVGSGESVTALYQVLPSNPDGNPIGVVRVRYRDPVTGMIRESEHPIPASAQTVRFEETPSRFRLAAAAAAFAEILRGSPYAAGYGCADVADVLRPVSLDLHLDRRVAEFLQLVLVAEGLGR